MPDYEPNPATPMLYVIPGSPSSWRVWLTLRRMGVEHRVERLSFNAGDTRSEGYRKLNWRGQVPLLVDGDLVLSESFAIIECLDETYGRGLGRSTRGHAPRHGGSPTRRMAISGFACIGRCPTNYS